MIAFLDIEASGLGAGSWPVEIGWALPYGRERNGAVLIKPIAEWTHWDEVAEMHFHRITRDQLRLEGHSPAEALDLIEAALAGCEVYVSDPAEDRSWFNRLVLAAGRNTSLKLHDAGPFLEAQALRRRHNLSAVRRDVANRFPHRHRAEADARQIAEVWRALVR